MLSWIEPPCGNFFGRPVGCALGLEISCVKDALIKPRSKISCEPVRDSGRCGQGNVRELEVRIVILLGLLIFRIDRIGNLLTIRPGDAAGKSQPPLSLYDPRGTVGHKQTVLAWREIGL